MDAVKEEKLKKITRITLVILLTINLINYYVSKYRTVKIPLPDVVVQHPIERSMAEYVKQTGNTVAYQSVDLVARIEGFLEDINFTDGTFVEKGKTLFLIEPETYLAKVKEAEAQLAADKAMYTYDKLEYARQKRMYKDKATSLSNVEKWLAKQESSAASVEKSKENLDIQKINYGYTEVKAPFDGRIGRHMIDKGNLVGKTAPTILATIEQLDPMYVYFNLNEIDFFRLREAAKEQGIDEKVIRQVPVEISLQKGLNYQYKGNLDFVNTGLNASTGTMEFRALLPNKDDALLPGLFVEIKIGIDPAKSRLTVPEDAIQFDQVGPYLLAVDKNNEVLLKRVELGPLEKGHRAIAKGVDKNDKIIIQGLQKVSIGHKVNPAFPKSKAT